MLTRASRAKVSEVLNRKRPLSIDMIRRLHAGLGIPAEVLIRPHAVQAASVRSLPDERRSPHPAW
jgi:plasmid maintenance system antidote protein VapI